VHTPGGEMPASGRGSRFSRVSCESSTCRFRNFHFFRPQDHFYALITSLPSLDETKEENIGLSHPFSRKLRNELLTCLLSLALQLSTLYPNQIVHTASYNTLSNPLKQTRISLSHSSSHQSHHVIPRQVQGDCQTGGNSIYRIR